MVYRQLLHILAVLDTTSLVLVGHLVRPIYRSKHVSLSGISIWCRERQVYDLIMNTSQLSRTIIQCDEDFFNFMLPTHRIVWNMRHITGITVAKSVRVGIILARIQCAWNSGSTPSVHSGEKNGPLQWFTRIRDLISEHLCGHQTHLQHRC